MPFFSFRGSAHSVTSHPPAAWMKTKNSPVWLDLAATSANAESGSPANARPFKNVRRQKCMGFPSSIQLKLRMAHEAVTNVRPAGLRGRKARFGRVGFFVSPDDTLVQLEKSVDAL